MNIVQFNLPCHPGLINIDQMTPETAHKTQNETTNVSQIASETYQCWVAEFEAL